MKYLDEAKFNSVKVLENIKDLLPPDNKTCKADLTLLMRKQFFRTYQIRDLMTANY